jgi:queuine tRNA-ribosyltransferase
MQPLKFDILARSGVTSARLGRVQTPHGAIDTPAFMPVGTRGSVKGLLPEDVLRTGSQIILNNTYHLLLRPGPELIAELGGVHRFMNWPGPILTDSGGFQAFSLSHLNAADDDGVTFKSIVDGSDVRLTPERAVQVQNLLGADIIMAFDDCPPAGAGEFKGAELKVQMGTEGQRDKGTRRSAMRGADAARLRMANERTIRWLERCKAAHGRPREQALFGIVQGGTDLELRSRSAEQVCGVDLPGYAIGGVAVGEGPEEIGRVVRHTAPLLPDGRPRYLMGVGYERDLLAAVLAGVDMFDCVLPTRNGRNANAFTRDGQIRLRNTRYARDPGPIEEGCDCPACSPAAYGWRTPDGRAFSRGYLRHLFMAQEMLGPILLSLHNVRYFQRFMMDIRRTIRDDDWLSFVGRWPRAAPGLPPGLGSQGHLSGSGEMA